MKDIPEYSDDAKDAIDLFLIDSYSAIFYFEDSRHESVYERLLERLIPDLRRYAVVCLGGKSRVIAKAREPRPNGTISVFVADKDFDDILGKIVEIEGLHYLERNCLENYFLDLDVLGAIAIEQDPDLTKGKVRKALIGQHEFLRVLEQRYEALTRLFIVANKYRVAIETTKMSMKDLLAGADDTFPVPTPEFLNEYRDRLKAHCHGANEWLTDDTVLDVQLEDAFAPMDGAHLLSTETLSHLSGKHLFRCLVHYINVCLAVNLSDLDSRGLYLRVLGKLDLVSLKPLRDKILICHPGLVQA